MKTIRRFTYAALLMLSALSFAPGQASAQTAAGTFTLTHEVHWKNAVVPAGKYHFTVVPTGPGEFITLHNASGTRASFILLATEAAESQPSDSSQLVLVPRAGGSFVSAMKLPDSGMTLHFAVPAETREYAQAVATAATFATR